MEKKVAFISVLTLILVIAVAGLGFYEYKRLASLEVGGGATAQKGAEASARMAGLNPDAMAGEKLYRDLACEACHKIKGKGGEGGPDLTHTGAKWDAEWHFKHLKDPQALVPGSTMPNMGLSDEDARALAAYMSTLK